MTNDFLITFANLVELCLVWCQGIRGDVFKHMQKLERLYLRCNNINTLGYLTNLKLLHIEDEYITDEDLYYLPNLESLTITLNHRNRITEDGFRYLVNLKYLTIYHRCDNIYDCECIDKITSNVFTMLPNIKSIKLNSCNHMVNKQMFDSLPILDNLDINFGIDKNDSIKYEKNLFKKLKVKHLVLDYGFRYLQRNDLKDLIKNNIQTLSIIREEYQKTRFSPMIQKKRVLIGKDILRFFKIIKRIIN